MENDGQLSIIMYVKLGLDFMGLMLSRVRILNTKDQNQILDLKHLIKLSGVVGWNLACLAYEEFIIVYGTKVFDLFSCTDTAICKIQIPGMQAVKKKSHNTSTNKEGVLGTVTIGRTCKPLCIHENFHHCSEDDK